MVIKDIKKSTNVIFLFIYFFIKNIKLKKIIIFFKFIQI